MDVLYFYTCIFSVPLIPMFIFYRMFKRFQIEIKGTVARDRFKSVDFAFKGATAFYVVIVAIIIFSIPDVRIFQIEGKLELDDTSLYSNKIVEFTQHPRIYRVRKDGSFTANFITFRNSNNSFSPDITIQIKGYKPRVIHLDKVKDGMSFIENLQKTVKVKLEEPIKLERDEVLK